MNKNKPLNLNITRLIEKLQIETPNFVLEIKIQYNEKFLHHSHDAS